MCSAIAASQDSALWEVALQGLVALVLMANYQGFRYLLERQQQRTLRDITREIRPGIQVEFKDRHSSLRVHHDPAPATAGLQEPPPEEKPPSNITPLRPSSQSGDAGA
jgi:hypothetical protein